MTIPLPPETLTTAHEYRLRASMRVNIDKHWTLTDEDVGRPGQPVLVNNSTRQIYTSRMVALIDRRLGPTSAAYGVTRLSRNAELTLEEREFIRRFTLLQ